MNEYIENKLQEAKIIIDGKTLYKYEQVKELNDLGVKLTFLKEGVRYEF